MAEQDSLFVVKRTILDPKAPTGLSFQIALPATFTDLRAAKEEAKALLSKEGYDTEFLTPYETKSDPSAWKHGDGVIVFAQAPSGQEFKVEIDTVANAAGLQADASGRIQQPLYHVVQTLIEYDDDRSGSERRTVVEGTFADRERARDHALRVLLDANLKREDFVEYDEYTDGTEGPFGPDVIVHAVKEGGENVLVSVIADQQIV
ncbi:hypothetical protein ACJQWK_07612 [Exserohilum turcicum]|uniref:Uncharacterized protein n=1 Tax=Exserohilum turcicum (strain 28A) TaxID=671987 RepID=R0IZS6_EXST2|nr:uncharacterized protein SETTUDRAFT_167155 [Exserohilum turcica Et28A]EOA90230.1 hypothetical protein SETTUDRAFT_167155 [Exserohilum turcica Et28A]